MSGRRTHLGRLVWWASSTVVYPLLVALSIGASGLILGALTSLDVGWSWMGALSLAVPAITVFVLFSLSVFFAMRMGAPHRLWVVPAVGLVAYASLGAIQVSRPHIDYSLPESSLVVVVSALLTCALVGAIVGEVLFFRRRHAHGEQAHPADGVGSEQQGNGAVHR